MCIAVSGKIIEICGDSAKVNVMGVETIVNIQLIENVKVGDYVLIHIGCAIEKIDKNYFYELNSIYEQMVENE